MHFSLRSSEVKVPVLSKAQRLIFPANGSRYGSVQNISIEIWMNCCFCLLFYLRYTNEVLTVIERTIGNSGGTTVVIIIIHLKKSLFLSRSSFYIP